MPRRPCGHHCQPASQGFGVDRRGKSPWTSLLLPGSSPNHDRTGTPANIITTASIAGLILAAEPCLFGNQACFGSYVGSVWAKLKDLVDHVKVSIVPGLCADKPSSSDDYRPERFAKGDDPHYQSEAYKQGLLALEKSIVTGTPIDPVGPRLFKAMEEGQKYIITHSEYMDAVKKRHAEIEADAKREKSL